MTQRSTSHPTNHPTSHRAILGLTLAAGIGFSIWTAWWVGRSAAIEQQTRFQRQIENLTTALQRSLNRYTDVLAFLGDYYRVQQPVQRQAFARYVARSLDTYPGIQALEWAPLVQQVDRLAFERAVQAEIRAEIQIETPIQLDRPFYITELAGDRLVRAGDRPYYVPVNYVVPLSDNEAAFGFDLNSNPARAAAIEAARDSGQITATSRIRLVQERRDQFGFLVLLPLYQSTQLAPSDLATRRQQFRGILVGVFRVSDVVEEALRDLRYDIDFVLQDQGGQNAFLGRYDAVMQQVIAIEPDPSPLPDSSLCPIAADCVRPLTVGQRQWQVSFSPSSRYAADPNYSAPIALLVGLGLTTSLVLFLHNLNRELTQTKILSDLKLRFFSMASHELRTPLSTILLSAESLQLNGDQFSEDQKAQSIQRIQVTAKQMSQQITDLLTLTQAEVGKLEFQPTLLEVTPYCEQIVSEMAAGMQQRIQLTSECAGIKAFWDKKLIRSLLTNLLSNAQKYSLEPLPVEINLRCDDQTATIEIRDRGIGIPAADQAKVQDAFYRGGNVGTVTGTGLGLAIVKTCVELHRGEWWIESAVGQGTQVTVKLPLE